MRIIEGYYMRLGDTIFYAKGVEHPPGKVIAYPKYVLDPKGERMDARRRRYRKLFTQEEQLRYLREYYNEYLVYDPYIGEEVPEIPLDSFNEVYDPLKRAKELLASSKPGIERDATDMILDLSSGFDNDEIGISGSLLVGLHNESSDIDLVVYGEDKGRKVYEILKERLKEEKDYKRYSKGNAEALYKRRREETPISWDEFLKQERRRILEGYYRNREYSIRLVRQSNSYGSKIVRKLGEATLVLEVMDSRESIFTPCRYAVRSLKVVRGPETGRKVELIYSLRERFTEIASEGDVIEARGEVEVWTYKTGDEVTLLYLGRKGDYMKLLWSRDTDDYINV